MSTEVDAREVWIEQAMEILTEFLDRSFRPYAARILIEHLRTQPEGYVLVPVEPTEAMIKIGTHVNSEWLNDNAPIGELIYRDPAIAVYKAMIAAQEGK